MTAAKTAFRRGYRTAAGERRLRGGALWLRTVLLLVLLAGGLGAQELQEPPIGPAPAGSARHLWAAGDENGIYLAVWKSLPQEDGFQILFLGKLADTLTIGETYIGQPLVATMSGGRFLVFLASGGCQSYTIDRDTRTEARLPNPFRPLACAAQGAELYVLVRAIQGGTIPLAEQANTATSGPADQKGRPAEPAAGGAVDKDVPHLSAADSVAPQPPQPPEQVAIQEQGLYILVRRGTEPWRSLTAAPLEGADWKQCSLAVLGRAVHVFGIESPVKQGEAPFGPLQYLRWEPGAVQPIQTLAVERAVAVTALVVNRQLRLVVAVGPPAPAAAEAAAPLLVEECRFRVGSTGETGWQFGEPLMRSADQELGGLPEQISFAAGDQSIAMFDRTNDRELLYGLYSPAGERYPNAAKTLLTQKPSAPVMRFLVWFFSPQTGLALMLAGFGLVIWRRRTIFQVSQPLPEFVRTASLGRRIVAFFLDSIPSTLAAYAWFPIPVDSQWQTSSGLWDRPDAMLENPQLLKFFAASYGIWLVYLTVTELLLAATPGKFLLQITILDESIRPMSTRQALLRNLMRIVEFHNAVPLAFILAVLTPRRQRLGDLLARTVVVRRTPELQEQLARQQDAGHLTSRPPQRRDDPDDPM
ncbi:MAG: RDD family protein [Sedimentisphaerales bacterium]|nr:RDD family protein [Sedimentisphaerales bacterium]